VVFEAARDSVFEPLKQRAGKILQEERFHAMYGATWLRSLSKKGTPARQEMNAAIQRIWPEAICWLGQPGEKYQQYALNEGLIDDDVDALRQKFLNRVGPLLVELEYDLPIIHRGDANRWELAVEPPWERWNPKTRRLS
jgi:ring-1,2-phenylacetyl-CoA epoxidase subunit PaaA/ring-1,2-phenylacetyl-CoA epoxidase subunit PaaC